MIDENVPNDPAEERRGEKNDRRTGDRRAHERYTPADGVRIDRRQAAERRRDRD